MPAECAPVVLMGYRRPEHTKKVFGAIRAARPPILLLVMDGPRPGESHDSELVDATRKAVEVVDWDCEVFRIYAESNMGLKKRVTTGLNRVFELVDSAIILEDDCLPSASFFPYASELLRRYANDDRVGIISGSQRVGVELAQRESYAFSRDIRIWGWATWSRTWRGFVSSSDLDRSWSKEEAQDFGKLFARGSRRKSMVSMMLKSSSLDSWALPFAVHCVSKGYLNPIPAQNLVRNIGLGTQSTHTGFENYVVDVEPYELDFPLVHPHEVAYTYPVDELESQRDARELYRYPFRHPIDTLRRVLRYLSRS